MPSAVRRPHPHLPRPRHIHRLNHQSLGQMPKTSHQTIHPNPHLTDFAAPWPATPFARRQSSRPISHRHRRVQQESPRRGQLEVYPQAARRLAKPLAEAHLRTDVNKFPRQLENSTVPEEKRSRMWFHGLKPATIKPVFISVVGCCAPSEVHQDKRGKPMRRFKP